MHLCTELLNVLGRPLSAPHHRFVLHMQHIGPRERFECRLNAIRIRCRARKFGLCRYDLGIPMRARRLLQHGPVPMHPVLGRAQMQIAKRHRSSILGGCERAAACMPCTDAVFRGSTHGSPVHSWRSRPAFHRMCCRGFRHAAARRAAADVSGM